MFINAKSGGRVGPRLLTVLFRSLGTAQVVRYTGLLRHARVAVVVVVVLLLPLPLPLPLLLAGPGPALRTRRCGPHPLTRPLITLRSTRTQLSLDLAESRRGPVLRTIRGNPPCPHPTPCLTTQFDLAESRPGPVLRTIWDNLLRREAEGDALAGHVRRCARAVVAGAAGRRARPAALPNLERQLARAHGGSAANPCHAPHPAAATCASWRRAATAR